MTELGAIIYHYFEQHLKSERGVRRTTITSYSDTLRLFLAYTAAQEKRRVTRLTLRHLNADAVRAFLAHLETNRGNSVATRNQRLAALRTFFTYAASLNPTLLHEAQKVANIPTKRSQPPATHYLERDQIDALFAGLPTTGTLALRDHTLLLFLYNTGARAQEAADLRADHLDLRQGARVILHGKGGKNRVAPLWPRTAELLTHLLQEQPTSSNADRPVFTSRRGTPLTRFGIYKLVKRHTKNLPASLGSPGAISPHALRHTTAMHLLEAGVDINAIRAWLGHTSLDTTNRYAKINTRAKEAALASLPPPTTSEGFPRKPIWQDDPTLLNWLQNL